MNPNRILVVRETMKPREFKLYLATATFLLCASGMPPAAEHYDVMAERNVPVKMRDGVVLRADIYRPKAPGKFPVFLHRTPYNKADCEACLDAAARGYIAIIQDCRGRYTSEGEWTPFKDEQADGYDTVEWAAALPYANGQVGMFGSSYVGATQMLAAIAAPPHLKAVCPSLTAANYHDGWIYKGGALQQWFSEAWTTMLAEDTFSRCMQTTGKPIQWVHTLPLISYPVLPTCEPQSQATYFKEWLKHPSYDEYWKQWSIEAHHSNIVVSAYHIGGWYHIFLGGTLRNYVGIKAHAGSDTARRSQRLLVGPWWHGPMTGQAGDINFSPGLQVQSDGDYLALDWYDYLFKGVHGALPEKPVKIFVMGKNVWREEDDWPRREPAPRLSFCIRAERRILSTVTAHSATRRLNLKSRTNMCTIRKILFRPAAAHCAVTTTNSLPALLINAPSSSGRMCWFTPRPPLTVSLRSLAL